MECFRKDNKFWCLERRLQHIWCKIIKKKHPNAASHLMTQMNSSGIKAWKIRSSRGRKTRQTVVKHIKCYQRFSSFVTSIRKLEDWPHSRKHGGDTGEVQEHEVSFQSEEKLVFFGESNLTCRHIWTAIEWRWKKSGQKSLQPSKCTPSTAVDGNDFSWCMMENKSRPYKILSPQANV